MKIKRKAKMFDVGAEIDGTRGWCAFDIETSNLAEDVGGWKNLRDLRFSYGVTYSHFDGYMLYVAGEERRLIDYVGLFTRNVSFNGDHFDLTVLEKYGDVKPLRAKSWDLLEKIRKECGHRVKLDQVGEALNPPLSKTANGTLAVKWWNSCSFEKRLLGFNYCRGDTEILVKAVERLSKDGTAAFTSKEGIKEVTLAW